MPNETLKNLSVRMPTGLQAVRSIIGPKSHVASRYVNEILQVVNSAGAEWREKGAASTFAPYEPEPTKQTRSLQTDAPAVETISNRPALANTADNSNAPRLSVQRSGTSSLFGEALRATERPRPTSLPTSSLFGHTVSNTTSELIGLSFLDVRRAVHAEFEQTLVPPQPNSHSSLTENAEAREVLPKPEVLPEPETVPFKSASSRTTKINPAVEATSVANPDRIVSVKRRRHRQNAVMSHDVESNLISLESSDISPNMDNSPRVSDGVTALVSRSLPGDKAASDDGGPASVSPSKEKRRRRIVSPNDESVTIPASPTALAPGPSDHADIQGSSSTFPLEGSPHKHLHPGARPLKKTKKGKMKAENIPEFEYGAEPNLLDHPASFRRRESKVKGKKEKKKGKPGEWACHVSDAEGKRVDQCRPWLGGADGGFGRSPADPSQPREGNRSGTFA